MGIRRCMGLGGWKSLSSFFGIIRVFNFAPRKGKVDGNKFARTGTWEDNDVDHAMRAGCNKIFNKQDK